MIPPLPTEILHHILKLSLPAVSFGTYTQRYNLLLLYSLINSTWRALARKELYEELFASDLGQITAAVSVKGAGTAVKRVHLGVYEDWGDDAVLAEAPLRRLRVPKTVTELRLASFRLKPSDFYDLPQLNTMHLHWCDSGQEYLDDLLFPPSSSQLFIPPLPSLTTLSLVDPFLFSIDTFPQWTIWFTPTTFPLLRRLSICFTSTSELLGHDENFRRALSQLAPQISAFTLAQGLSNTGTEVDFPWASFSALDLRLYPRMDRPSALFQSVTDNLPIPLWTLIVSDLNEVGVKKDAFAFWHQRLLDELAFAKQSTCLRDLRALVVEHGVDEMSDGIVDSLTTLRRERIHYPIAHLINAMLDHERAKISWSSMALMR